VGHVDYLGNSYLVDMDRSGGRMAFDHRILAAESESRQPKVSVQVFDRENFELEGLWLGKDPVSEQPLAPLKHLLPLD